MVPSTCDPPTGFCSQSGPKRDGTSCDDGNVCTSGDACLSGVCQGTPSPVTFTISLNPSSIKFHNHKMVDVVATPQSTFDCGVAPSVILVSVTSSEPDNAPGPSDGDTINDIQGVTAGTADFNFQVRAEVDRNGPGRDYTVTYRATFSSAQQVTSVNVIHVSGFGP